MSTDFSPKPFPIPVVGLVGPGTQAEDEQLDYLRMPAGMDTYRPPVLPEPEELAGHGRAVSALHQVLAALLSWLAGEPAAPVSLAGLDEADLALVNQVLGEGEVSAQVLAAPGDASQAWCGNRPSMAISCTERSSPVDSFWPSQDNRRARSPPLMWFNDFPARLTEPV